MGEYSVSSTKSIDSTVYQGWRKTGGSCSKAEFVQKRVPLSMGENGMGGNRDLDSRDLEKGTFQSLGT